MSDSEITLSDVSNRITTTLSLPPYFNDDLETPLSTAACVPTEILLPIFEYACTLQNVFALVLGGVSRRWRQIAWATPSLWTSLRITMWIPHHDVSVPKRCIDVLQLYFKNVHTSSLDLGLDVRDEIDYYGPLRFIDERCVDHEQLIMLLLQVYPSKLRSIKWPKERSRWYPAICRRLDQKLLMNLEVMGLSWSDILLATHPRVLCLSHLTALSLILPNVDSTRTFYLSIREFHCPNLTSVKLDRFYVDQALHFLTQIPSLKSFSSTRTWYYGPSGHADRGLGILRLVAGGSGDITVPNLETLKWDLSLKEDGYMRFLFTRVRLPSLRRVHVYAQKNKGSSPQTQALFRNFIRRLPRLEVLEGDIPFMQAT
ncbi:hypothetical protein AN958_11319 [Leucoagaricus sp. SymC.cos]|nr:hypothetical protein AN958_11319 [Leucoagaricus sp. SymC.cos]